MCGKKLMSDQITGQHPEPFYKAADKCREIQRYGEKLAEAAYKHPEIPFEATGFKALNPKQKETLEQTEPVLEAELDIKLYTWLISDLWDEANEYMFHDFEREADEYARKQHSLDYDEMMGLGETMMERYTTINRELRELDAVLDRKFDDTLLDSSKILEVRGPGPSTPAD